MTHTALMTTTSGAIAPSATQHDAWATLANEWLELGEKVTVSFASDKCFVFPYPTKGLREELLAE